jgi:hypothetical protein
VKKSAVEKTPATGRKILAIRRPQSNPRGWAYISGPPENVNHGCPSIFHSF